MEPYGRAALRISGIRVIMEIRLKWDGQFKGSILGTRIFFSMISLCGVVPAYVLLAPVSLYYAAREKASVRAVKELRRRLGLPAGFFHCWRHFYSFGMNILDRYAFLARRRPPFRFSSVNEEFISSALSGGKGVILLSAHVGNWEIAGNLLSDRIGRPVSYTMVDAEKPEVRRIFGKAFENRRISVIRVSPEGGMEAMVDILNALRRNEVVCMHGDRMFGKKGQRVPFLGDPVEFPIGPFAIAAATGAPIVPIFAYKRGFKHYLFRAFDPIAVQRPGDDRTTQITEGLKKFVHSIECVVKENPYEWFNFFDFWVPDRTQPILKAKDV
jgi:predicted LPLAT superfamily acyltransferase